MAGGGGGGVTAESRMERDLDMTLPLQPEAGMREASK